MSDIQNLIVSNSLPIFESPYVKILFSSPVQKLNRHKKFDFRILVISNAGIFLFRRRSFPSSLKLSHIIPYESVLSLHYDKSNTILTINSTTKKFPIQHDDLITIATLIIRVHDSYLPSLTVEGDIPLNQGPYHIEGSLLAQRFLSSCVEGITPNLLEPLDQTYSKLSSFKSKVVFSPKLFASPLFAYIQRAVCCEPSVATIEVKSLSNSSFSHNLHEILTTNEFITTLSFRNYIFIGQSKSDLDLLGADVISPISNLNFIDCELNHIDFKSFIKDIIGYKGSITSLKFVNCAFSPITINSTFMSFFAAPCFLLLESFEITGVHMDDTIQQLIAQLMGSTQILQNKALKSLKVTNCDVDCTFLLPAINFFETGLERLTLSANNFKGTLNLTTFQQIHFLDLSETSFNSKSLTNFFTVLSTCSQTPEQLVLKYIKIEETELAIFYEMIGRDGNLINNLQSLSWENNHIPSENCASFFKFLKKQTNLKELNLSCCILSNSYNISNYIKELCGLLKVLKLKQFIINANENNSQTNLGPKILQLFKAIQSSPTIKKLEISGQCFDDTSIPILLDLVNSQFSLFIFNGTQCSFPKFLDLLQAIINSQMIFSVWPSSDYQRVSQLLKVNGKINGKTIDDLEEVKKQFSQRFESQDVLDLPDDDLSVEDDVHMSIDTNYELPLPILLQKDADLVQMLNECLFLPENETLVDHDPLIRELKNLYGPESILQYVTDFT